MTIQEIFALTGLAMLISGGVCGVFQLYRLVRADAQARGRKHPRLWGLFAAGGNQSSGLLAYLLIRRKFPVTAMNEDLREEIALRKKRVIASLIFLAAGGCLMVLAALVFADLPGAGR